jgi:hypothetical protein
MDLVPYLSTVIVVATLATVILAVFSYAAFKVRDKRRPKEEASAPVFFRRYRPASAEPDPPDDLGGPVQPEDDPHFSAT